MNQELLTIEEFHQIQAESNRLWAAVREAERVQSDMRREAAKLRDQAQGMIQDNGEPMEIGEKMAKLQNAALVLESRASGMDKEIAALPRPKGCLAKFVRTIEAEGNRIVKERIAALVKLRLEWGWPKEKAESNLIVHLPEDNLKRYEHVLRYGAALLNGINNNFRTEDYLDLLPSRSEIDSRTTNL